MNPTSKQISTLETKLKETLDLLHIWKNEAFSYRTLAFAILDGSIEAEDARLALKAAEPTRTHDLNPSR